MTLTAAAPRAVIERPIRGAMMPLLVVLAALAALLTVATLVQLRLGLRPLRRLRNQVAAIRTGAAARIDGEQPTELKPLVAELNALTTANAATLATARTMAANLAHSLKTPVATLALALGHDTACAAQVARIDATIRHHLARARATATNQRAATPLDAAIGDLVATVGRHSADRNITIVMDVAPDLVASVDAADLDELIGNLLDNAVRHASRQVSVVAARDAGDSRRAVVEIADDGAGIAAIDRDRAVTPGVRLDERGSGHGFGLSIVAELAALYGGSLVLAAAPTGGLLARLTVPLVASP